MDNLILELLNWARQQQNKLLPDDPRYRRAQAEREALWAQISRRYPFQVRRAALHLVNLENELSAMETEYAFLLGLQLGFRLGGLQLVSRD